MDQRLYKEFIDRGETVHAPYGPEFEFYAAVKAGDAATVRRLLTAEPFGEKAGLGKLSDNSLQNMKYHFAIKAALIARYCIDGGMSLATAYSLSDFFINKADRAKSIEELSELNDIMCIDYTMRMSDILTTPVKSRHVARAIDYIYDHLDTTIKAYKLAESLNLSQEHLSRLFKKETGVGINEYILKAKIETAARMLEYTDITISDISAQFAFASQSHFTSIFKKFMGESPSVYRNKRARSTELKV